MYYAIGTVGWVFIFLGAFFVLLVLICLIRALTFYDKTNYNRQVEEIKETDDVVDKLAQMLKVKTISYENKEEIDFSKFQEYIDLTKKLYPLVFEKCEFEQTKEYAIKLKLKGKSSEKPTVLMAHYDVVPVEEENWQPKDTSIRCLRFLSDLYR